MIKIIIIIMILVIMLITTNPFPEGGMNIEQGPSVVFGDNNDNYGEDDKNDYENIMTMISWWWPGRGHQSPDQRLQWLRPKQEPKMISFIHKNNTMTK